MGTAVFLYRAFFLTKPGVIDLYLLSEWIPRNTSDTSPWHHSGSYRCIPRAWQTEFICCSAGRVPNAEVIHCWSHSIYSQVINIHKPFCVFIDLCAKETEKRQGAFHSKGSRTRDSGSKRRRALNINCRCQLIIARSCGMCVALVILPDCVSPVVHLLLWQTALTKTSVTRG